MDDPTPTHSSRSEAYHASAKVPSNPSSEPSLLDVTHRRYGRRDMLSGMLGTGTIAGLTFKPLALFAGGRASAIPVTFAEISHGVDHTHHVAGGYDAHVLIRWGDPVEPGAPAFHPHRQSAARQAKQFGYNNDFIAYLPLPFGSANSDHGLLCVNHEYTDATLMFSRVGTNDTYYGPMTQETVGIEMAGHGGSIIEVRRGANGLWTVVENSRYARRITVMTPMRLAGPAAGHGRLRTAADPSGRRVLGTVNNCAGGATPWGTYLMAEENFEGYYSGTLHDHPEQRNHERYGVPGRRYAWGRFDLRWNLNAEPNEANRFGWIVEVDPYDRSSVPVKRTALGRFKHEGAALIVNRDGRVIVYSADDQQFEYLYKYVSDGRHDPKDRRAGAALLDKGTLFVAKFAANGTLQWLPLVWGAGPLVPANGFASQADVLIETRRAADLLHATPLDRPEDVQPNPRTDRVYVMLTKNRMRAVGQEDAVNRRAENIWGQIVELTPPGGDHAARVFQWDILVQCGDPQIAAVGASWNLATSKNGWFSNPDNCAFDNQGRLWVTTDQGDGWAKASGTADGVWAVDTHGPSRGTGRMFFRGPVGAEICGPCFTPDDQTLFVAVQHPGASGTEFYEGFGRASTFDDPATRWPDFDPQMPPRPSIVAITRKGGGRIGS